jgi:hypothetical protein
MRERCLDVDAAAREAEDVDPLPFACPDDRLAVVAAGQPRGRMVADAVEEQGVADLGLDDLRLDAEALASAERGVF